MRSCLRYAQFARLSCVIVALAPWAIAPAAHGQTAGGGLAHVAAAVLYDASAFGQDAQSQRQLGVIPSVGRFRIDRVIVNGTIPFPAPWSYLFSADYQGLEHAGGAAFAINDLAVIVPIGHIVSLDVGRQKEGVTAQMMASTRTIALTERPAPLTAFVPSRNDGVRITAGDARHGRWSLGWFNSTAVAAKRITPGSSELSARGFVTSGAVDSGTSILQFGGTARWAGAPDGVARFKAKPEMNVAPSFVDTGPFASHGSGMIGAELVAQHHGLSFLSEAVTTRASRVDSGAVTFDGEYAEVAWRPGGEARSYSATDGTLGRVRAHDRRGAVELAARVSRVDLTSHGIDGGVFDRVSGAINWFALRSIRVSVDYGLGRLVRDAVVGHTHFFTARVQWESP